MQISIIEISKCSPEKSERFENTETDTIYSQPLG